MRHLKTSLGALIVLAGTVAVSAAPVRAAPAEPRCPGPGAGLGARYVVLLPGFLSSSLTGPEPGVLDPANHQVREAFAPLRAALADALDPPPHVVYFSYGLARLLASGDAPLAAWLGDTFLHENEPRYWMADTSDFPVQEHADALGWLLRALLDCDPAASFDLIGYSLGGIIALRWVVTEEPGPESPLVAVHRVILVDSPVGGLNPALLPVALAAAPPAVVAAAGTGRVLADLLSQSEVVQSLRAAATRVDLASIENSRDYLVNGAPVPGAPPDSPDAWLGRGAAASFLPPGKHAAVWYRDMGDGAPGGASLWAYLVAVHGVVLRDEAAAEQVAALLREDGPRWCARRAAALAAGMPTVGAGPGAGPSPCALAP